MNHMSDALLILGFTRHRPWIREVANANVAAGGETHLLTVLAGPWLGAQPSPLDPRVHVHIMTDYLSNTNWRRLRPWTRRQANSRLGRPGLRTARFFVLRALDFADYFARPGALASAACQWAIEDQDTLPTIVMSTDPSSHLAAIRLAAMTPGGRAIIGHGPEASMKDLGIEPAPSVTDD